MKFNEAKLRRFVDKKADLHAASLTASSRLADIRGELYILRGEIAHVDNIKFAIIDARNNIEERVAKSQAKIPKERINYTRLLEIPLEDLNNITEEHPTVNALGIHKIRQYVSLAREYEYATKRYEALGEQLQDVLHLIQGARDWFKQHNCPVPEFLI